MGPRTDPRRTPYGMKYSRVRFGAIHRHGLDPIRKKGSEPIKNSAADVKRLTKTLQKTGGGQQYQRQQVDQAETGES